MADYVEFAVQLAHELSRLAKWRAELLRASRRSPLCDGPLRGQLDEGIALRLPRVDRYGASCAVTTATPFPAAYEQ